MMLLAAAASLFGAFYPFMPSFEDIPGWGVFLILAGSAFLLLIIYFEVTERRPLHVYRKSDERGIRRYMHGWIEHGGRVAIWTRDMSWAQNFETKELLVKKAQKGELILCLPETNEFASELQKEGAELCAYGMNDIEHPSSRFTIAYYGRDGSRVAVGRAEGDCHVIDEFKSGTHPAYYLAEDLIKVARTVAKQGFD